MRTKGLKNVTVRIGRTYNLGNYESVRIDVGCELEAQKNDSNEDIVERASEFCEDALLKLEKTCGVDYYGD